MSDVSGYDDDVYPVTIGGAAPVDKDVAQGFLSKYRTRADAASAQFDDLMKRREAAISVARQRLDDTIAQMREKHQGGSGGINLPLLALGAGLLSPDPRGGTSNFAQELGRGLSSMGQTIRAQRMSDVDFLRGISELERRSAEMADAPLKDAMTLEARKQAAAEAAAAGVERQLIRAGAPGSTPAKLKEFEEWKKSPGNEAKSYQDFLKWRADELGADKTPAIIREYTEWKKSPGNEAKSLADFYSDKARTQAGGKELGKSQAEAQLSLPDVESTIDQMASSIATLKNHPGLSKAVGWPSLLYSLPEGDPADFEALLEQFKGQAFLVQFNKLRGAGAITESEGKKATDALAALSLKQKPEAFKKNLDTALSILERGRENARKKAGTAAPAASTTTVKTKADYDKLPSGSTFVDPEGNTRVKP